MRSSATLPIALTLLVSACGTTYEVVQVTPDLMAATSARHAAAARDAAPAREAEEDIAMFTRVRDRVEPVAERFCAEETEPGTVCDYDIVVDPARDEINAYQTYVDATPTLIFTPAFLSVVANDDELAFVMGHEAGHHIAGHLDKKETQHTAGAIGGALLGATILVLAAAAGAQPSQSDIDAMVIGGGALGGAAGGIAYSQTYELEADTIGAYVAEAAGFDPERGAVVFPRLEHADHPEPEDGHAAFWSTHPSSPERLAAASLVAEQIRTARAAGETPRPERAKSLSDRISESLDSAFEREP